MTAEAVIATDPIATQSVAAGLPDFVVIGAMKAGTTSLYRYLMGHPQIAMSRMKETDFFIETKNWSLGAKWYASQFPKGNRLKGEVSPNYTKSDIFPGVPERLASQAPEAKLIFIARDPVDRFVSQYKHEWLLGHMAVPPEDILKTQSGRQIIRHSSYAAELGEFLAFFPRAQLLILDFDALSSTPETVIFETTEFLGIDTMHVCDLGAFNEGEQIARMPGWVQRTWRSKAVRRLDPLISRGMRDAGRRLLARGPARKAPEIPAEIRSRIADALRADAQAFRDLSGMPFSGWSV